MTRKDLVEWRARTVVFARCIYKSRDDHFAKKEAKFIVDALNPCLNDPPVAFAALEDIYKSAFDLAVLFRKSTTSYCWDVDRTQGVLQPFDALRMHTVGVCGRDFEEMEQPVVAFAVFGAVLKVKDMTFGVEDDSVLRKADVVLYESRR